MTYSIKKSQSILWKTGYSREDILKQHNSWELEDNWLVCPHGESEQAVSVLDFVRDPEIFEALPDSENEPPPVTDTNDRVPETLTTIGLRVSFTAGAAKALYYLFTYFQLKPAVTSLSESSNRLFQVQPKPPSVGFATFRECLNDFSSVFLYFGLAALLAGLVLDRLEQTKNSQ